jgi:L-ribulose-5-phosphate 4-epimerase
MSKFIDIREECCEANRALGASGLVDLTFGNVSVLDRDAGVFAIKPSGVDYSELTPANMVLVDLEGKTLEGELRPSSDTPTHGCLFRAIQGIRAVVHTHSRYATSFAQAARAFQHSSPKQAWALWWPRAKNCATSTARPM